MGIEQEIDAVRAGIHAGRFLNEASVSQGVVLRLLAALSWPIYDTQVVCPEYSLSGRRVDFALCHPPGKPIAFIEVKQVGQSDGAERQLFEYAFHDGIPLAILTDGREWNFFLPGEQGAYGERRVYKLDIVERDVGECAARLQRYLNHSAIASGEAMQAARDDYRNVARERQMKASLPIALAKLIEDEDGALLEIVADRTETLCGFKPDQDMVAQFLKKLFPAAPAPVSTPPRLKPRQAFVDTPEPMLSAPQAPITHSAIGQNVSKPLLDRFGYELEGQFFPARNAIDVLTKIFENLSARDATFSERFAAMPHGRTRRYLAIGRDELYPGRADLCREHATQLSSGWWLGTNHSRQTIEGIIKMACGILDLRYGIDLIAHLAVSQGLAYVPET